MAITGYVMQLQHFSVNDGEGIRTTIFLAGCPLRCKWCANPEGFDHHPKIAYYSKTCSGCGRCAAVCLHGIGINLNAPGNRDKCLGCGACVSVCPNGSRKQLISKMTVDEIVAAILPQLRFLQDSGGGVTFSGGEATSQRAFLHAAAKRF
ncbi:MAG: 4Fe-4S cluster-binding domain-containing protein, partial [Firmicutes bacterium]|nr:4Fe-4S cluster-binding domain-containing protein [Bacillota bacterium]